MLLRKINIIDLFPLAFLGLFFIDCIVNYFMDIPVLVAGSIIIFPLIFYYLRIPVKDYLILGIFVLTFLTTMFTSNLLHGFNLKNISDLIFILTFITVYFLYYHRADQLNPYFALIFLLVCLILFLPDFLGINRSFSGLSTDSEDLEFLREYHQGFFRIAHVGSYFFGFLALYFIYFFKTAKDKKFLILGILSLGICVYIGSRTFLFAIFISFLIFFIRKKYLKYFIILIALLVFIIWQRNWFLRITEGTIFFQYFSFIQTFMINTGRLSRVLIWSSWWNEISQFNLIDFMIGKTYFGAHKANLANLGTSIWFHNDFLNIAFSYGLFSVLLYIYFYIKIFIDFKQQIQSNILIFIFYFSMIFSAIMNGFYYYFPVFLLYLFLLMVSTERGSNEYILNKT